VSQPDYDLDRIEDWTTSCADDAESDLAWQQMLSGSHLPWAVSLPAASRPPLRNGVRRQRLDDLTLIDCVSGPCSVARQRREIALTDGEHLGVLIAIAGAQHVQLGTSGVTQRAEDVLTWESSRPVRFTVTQSFRGRTVIIPRAALDEVDTRAWAAGGLPLSGGTPAMRLLRSFLDAAGNTLPGLSPAAVASARNATLELLTGALRTDVDVTSSSAMGSALLLAMERYIDRQLLHGALTPAAVAAAHGVSVRTAQRAYHASGETLGEAVRRHRLAHARQDLVGGNTSISAIATRWGFADTGHFSRTFKARYGAAPSDYRGSARGSMTQATVR
jgi:AraC family transcriptional regulator, positive regulator of tynA and feaB